MNKTILALAITSALGACSGPQKVVTPGGTNRVPINTEAALAKLSTENAKQANEEADTQRKDASREALEATVANLQKQVQFFFHGELIHGLSNLVPAFRHVS